MKVSGKILYNVVKDVMRDNNITFDNNDKSAVMVWYDTIKDMDYWSTLAPYQIVNRIPNINILCRKTSCIRLLHNMNSILPSIYSFLPVSYILPLQSKEFSDEVQKHTKKFIIKPDDGALGKGITIIKPEDNYVPSRKLLVAQEYVESFLINETKFDCRVYALIASITPLRIYIYRNGVARFCSEKNGNNSMFSQITNTAFNKNNHNIDIKSITKTVSDVFKTLQKMCGIDPEVLWAKIDSLIVLTIMSAYAFLQKGEINNCPSYGYTRCFQILGFDILFDNQLNPKLLEVNYRPSFSTLEATPDEYNLKKEMLTEVIKLFSHYSYIQEHILRRNWYNINWMMFQQMQYKSEHTTKLVRIYPANNKTVQQIYNKVLYYAEQMPVEIMPNIRLPVQIHVNLHHYPLSNISFSYISRLLYTTSINNNADNNADNANIS